MKKFVLSLYVLLFVTLLFSCNKDEREIKNVAQNYLQAIKDKDFEKAKEFSATEYVEALDVIQIIDEQIVPPKEEPTYNVECVEITNDTMAEVFYTKKLADVVDTFELSMLKEKNAWKVIPSKEN